MLDQLFISVQWSCCATKGCFPKAELNYEKVKTLELEDKAKNIHFMYQKTPLCFILLYEDGTSPLNSYA